MKARWGWVMVALLALSGGFSCGAFPEDFIEEEPYNGPVCYTDADCVPSACCGEGTRAVHISQAPDCRNIRCNGTCSVNTIDCGCGLPICRSGRCAVAYSSGAGCP